ncbi:hypothetical protein JG687_00018321 [Phytophthora cactorum]|uniref:Uncharacterized protein n=1 Tax=Phytophthora cactorum TaxID=29920 RepID=A0A329SAW2_9STRA|nr:hypothetical protein Pcac1_g17764 [Phytophthora cactorum]KAG2799742.1 hypothetical protein PC112_g20772 [Phytophthora cactorum]KAG2828163.1 hypothetical protein PC111_g8271 [Phytophthora cactorum]KAG2850895.1 hypothetical protein PC113_g16376 [Phytophthora cactorum]KAG2878660.1 hypothetical protein PC114_g22977 [Phytophthora cactorum]
MVNCERSPSRKDNPRSKKRIPTYVIRKEEARALEEEVQALHKQLAALQDAKDTASIKLSTTKNQILREYLHTQELAIASTSAMLFNHLSNQPDNPIKAHIHLPKHQAARRETLVNMKNDKFRQCHEYLAARSRSLDMTKDHFSVDQYEDTDGNLICQRFDVTHFHGVKSLKQVYDALVFFMFNIEISISETLGDITVRDDYDIVDNGAYISNHRLVSNHDIVTSEVNAATFAQHFDGPNPFESSTCAFLATDTVDEDDLHPYNSLEFVRRDVSAALVLTEELKKSAGSEKSSSDWSQDDSEGEEECVVVMRRVVFTKIHNPNFEVPENALIDISERVTQWAKVMMQAIQDVIDTQS